MKRLLLGLCATLVMASGVWPSAPSASALNLSACNGVWVVVDFGSLGGDALTKCATGHATGAAALKNTFGAALGDGMIERISGKPSKPDLQKAYWSYWQAKRKSDGSYSAWAYSNLGVNASHPAKGSAEGWHYVSLSESASGPGAKPPANPETKPAPSATPKTSPAPKATSRAKPSPASSVTAKASDSPSPTAPSSPVATTPTPADSATPEAGDDPEPTPPAEAPVALIGTAVVIVAGGAGAGIWWLRKGRHR